MRFTKMQGCGNDYVYINGFKERIPEDRKKDIVIALSDRHFGIGSDGVIFINPSNTANCEMEMYNADGSRAEMCGNGIRCVAKYVYDNSIVKSTHMTIESAGKTKIIDVFEENGVVTAAKVDMGRPELLSELIPVKAEKDNVIDEPIMVNGREYRMTCVSMGNPHAVVFLDPDGLDIEKIGPYFESHERFPRKTNTEFVKVLDRQNVRMRVWERGTGETLACGTGCCATAVACVLNGLTDDEITVHVLGGDIKVKWDRENDRVYMTGPATTVFSGEI
ncbi:MAG: diaminopimelate epimerase, partial [Lachnospiraceae bacterium]|nr:diaminopimelate epimerase [Lachnospiraceae bacterium]